MIGLANALTLPLPVGEGLRTATARSPGLIPRPLRLAVTTREELDVADALLDATDAAEARLLAGDARWIPAATPSAPGLAFPPTAAALVHCPVSSGVCAALLLRPLLTPPAAGDG